MFGDNQLSSYKWIVDNTSLTFSGPWSLDNPNSADAQCVTQRVEPGKLTWNDRFCSKDGGAICEADLVNIFGCLFC